MIESLFVVVVLALLLGVLAWFLRRRFCFDGVKIIVVITWAYYTLSVPLDLFFGFNVDGSYDLPDLSDARHFSSLILVTAYSVLFLASYLAAYSLVFRKRVRTASTLPQRHRHLCLPAVPVLYVIVFALVTAYVCRFDTIHRGMIGEMTRTDVSLTLLSLCVDIATAASVVYIIESKTRLQALLALPAGLIMALLTGGRSALIIPVCVYLLRFRVEFKGMAVKRVAIVVFVMFVLVYFKTIYHAWAVHRQYGETVSLADQLPDFGFSKFESIDAVAYFVLVLEEGPPPMWMGKTYTEIPVRNTLPRFMGDWSVPTLAQSYAKTLIPNYETDPHGMGFSALAESWLNFGVLGPMFLGVFWGLLSSYFDNHERRTAFYVFAIMCLRLFRTDFASLYKTWVVVFVFSLAVVYGFLYMYSLLLPQRRTRRRIGRASPVATWNQKQSFTERMC